LDGKVTNSPTNVRGLGQKAFGPRQRGQARLPDLELFKVEVMIITGKAFNLKESRKYRSLKVGKAGLSPLLLD